MYKTGHAFTYLLLTKSVANDIINVSLFAYDEISIDLRVQSKNHVTSTYIDIYHSTPDFIAPDMWPPNSSDLSPVDYSIWSVMQQRV